MRTPLAVITGVDPDAMDAAALSLAWDLPAAVAIRHRIDPESQILTHVVSSATGILEEEQIPLEHACSNCALREDILPTLRRLSTDDRWQSIVACLPVGAEPEHLINVLARDTLLARQLRLSAVIAAVGADQLADDLLGNALLRDRDLHSNPDDNRGIGEVSCAQIEHADVVVLDEDPGREATDLLRALAQPQARLIIGADQLVGADLVEAHHHHQRTTAWCSPMLDATIPPLGESRAWRIDLRSSQPFHPERLLDQIERLGSGRHRSRGCFWLPSRPGIIQEWGGAGGQLSIGTYGPWGRLRPVTRLIMTGLGDTPRELITAFEDLLIAPKEAIREVPRWAAVGDGLEPWLGDISDAA